MHSCSFLVILHVSITSASISIYVQMKTIEPTMMTKPPVAAVHIVESLGMDSYML